MSVHANIARDEIPFLHWQHRVLPGPAGAFGEIVSGLDDLEQDIRIIALTPKGSVPGEPEKFCDLLDYVDRPFDVAVPNMTRELWDALAAHAPRIVVDRVEVTYRGLHHFELPVFWRPRADVAAELRRTVVEITPDLAAAALERRRPVA